MNLENLKKRMLENKKTTSGGIGLGLTVGGVIWAILQQAGCDFSSLSVGAIISAAIAGPAVQGALSTDNGKSDVVQGGAK